jgi:hypothetical protein
MAFVISDALRRPEKLRDFLRSESGWLEGTNRAAVCKGVVERHSAAARRSGKYDGSRRWSGCRRRLRGDERNRDEKQNSAYGWIAHNFSLRCIESQMLTEELGFSSWCEKMQAQSRGILQGGRKQRAEADGEAAHGWSGFVL